MRNVFVPESNCTFPIAKRHFSYNWFGLYSWLTHSPVFNGTYCLFCVLFFNKVFARKKNWCIFPILIGVMLRISDVVSSIHSESIKIFPSILNEMAGRWYLSMFKLFKEVNKPRKTTEFYCQSLTFLKLLGEWVFF